MMRNESNSILTPVDIGKPIERLVELGDTRGSMRLWTMVRHGRRFVLKGLAPELRDNPVYQALLRKEFELGMKLAHPAIVRTWSLESGSETGMCVVMDFVDGMTLGEFVDTMKPSLSERLRLALELADVLAYLHEAGVCHRDLKPDNIMVTRRRHNIMLIDLGLGDSEDFAIFKQSAATEAYGAPEQLSGLWGDERADVYAFGRIAGMLGLPIACRLALRRCVASDPDRRPPMAVVASRLRQCCRARRRWPYAAALTVSAAVVMSALMNRAVDDPAAGSFVAPTDTVTVAAATTDSVDTVVPTPVVRHAEAAPVVNSVDEVIADAVARGEALTRRLMPAALALEDLNDQMAAVGDMRDRLTGIEASMADTLRRRGLAEDRVAACGMAFWRRIIEVQNEVIQSSTLSQPDVSTSNLTPLRDPAM